MTRHLADLWWTALGIGACLLLAPDEWRDTLRQRRARRHAHQSLTR